MVSSSSSYIYIIITITYDSSLGTYAFFGCTGLTSVTIASGTTWGVNGYNQIIYEYAFSGCTSLSSVTIPNTVTQIYTGAFLSCPLTCLNWVVGLAGRYVYPNAFNVNGVNTLPVCTGTFLIIKIH